MLPVPELLQSGASVRQIGQKFRIKSVKLILLMLESKSENFIRLKYTCLIAVHYLKRNLIAPLI